MPPKKAATTKAAQKIPAKKGPSSATKASTPGTQSSAPLKRVNESNGTSYVSSRRN